MKGIAVNIEYSIILSVTQDKFKKNASVFKLISV